MVPLTPPANKSSMVAAIGYEQATRTLAIMFVNGIAAHHFLDVPQDIADGFMVADSPGRFFNQNIRGKYEQRLTTTEAAEPATT